MSTAGAPVPLPRVAAVLIAHDGEEWLPSVLGTLANQTYPALDLVVVDNGSADGTGELLERRIPADRLIRLPSDIGFGRAVAAALQNEAVAGAELLLLVHDDLVLAPDAIARLVIALRQDTELAIVGPKLREWSDEDVLQEVGMTIDRFGRAENRLEPGELDQGQHDRQLEVLYVSTAGMMIRLDALRTLGGFDARFPAFREDLDLCWRAWLAGKRVAVVPAAVGWHIAAGSRLARPFGKGRPWEARYLAERHTLAALLKNYSAASLAWVLPLVLLLAMGKTGAFLVTRRFGDAIAVLRAYAWNLFQLGRTLRRRRIVQSRRASRDSEISHLFAPGLPRARAYAEALGNWLAGGSTRALLDDGDAEEAQPDEGAALVRMIRRHPAAVSAVVLLVVYVTGLVRFFGDGQIVGGDIAPWPESARDFFRSYASPWNGEPAGSGAFASPVQVVLGFLSFLGLGSAWLAQRLVVFGLLPAAWAFALRAGRLVTTSVWPRVLGATLYALSPVLLGALAQGRIGVLLLSALLPGLVLLAARAADPATRTATAWRSAALLSLGLTAGVAAAPLAAVPVVAAYAVLLAYAFRRRASASQPALCLGMAGLAAFALLSPWLVGVLREGGALGRVTGNPELPLWRALAAVPQVVPGLGGLAGVLIAASAVGLVVAAVILGLQARPMAVTGLVTVLVLSGMSAWALTRLESQAVWTPALLLPAALALSGLALVAAHYLGGGLRHHAFGLRQLAVLLAAGMLTLGLAGGVARLASGPWRGLAMNPEVIPAFVGADQVKVGPYRVVLLDTRDGAVGWELAPAEGPRMTRFGTTPSRALLAAVGEAVEGAAGGADPQAGGRLGLLNVRYLVLQGDEPDASLVEALIRQPALEPLPSGGGRVFRVDSWLPRASVLSAERAEALLTTGDPGVGGDGVTPLNSRRPGVYRAEVVPPGVVVVTEATSPVWRAASERGGLPRRTVEPVNGFEFPAAAQVVEVRAAGGAAHATVAVVQALLLLGVLSLALRPPGFTQARVERQLARELPSGLARAVAEPLDPRDLAGTAGQDDEEPIDFDEPEVVESVRASEPAVVESVRASEPEVVESVRAGEAPAASPSDDTGQTDSTEDLTPLPAADAESADAEEDEDTDGEADPEEEP